MIKLDGQREKLNENNKEKKQKKEKENGLRWAWDEGKSDWSRRQGEGGVGGVENVPKLLLILGANVETQDKCIK